MQPFDYLIVLTSIILGLTITDILGKLAKVIHRRDTLKLYYPPLIWMAILFLQNVQYWWGLYSRKNDFPATLFSFLFIVTSPIILYLLSAINLPELQNGSDLRMHYSRNRMAFFGLGVIGLAVLILDSVIILDAPFFHGENWMRFAGMLAIGSLIFVENDRYNLIVTVGLLALLLLFIVSFSNIDLTDYN